MTNFEKIKNMSVEEMAKEIQKPICRMCHKKVFDDNEKCENWSICEFSIQTYLQSEAD